MHLPSEISTKSSKLYSPLKPLRKSSTSLSNLFDNTSDYITSQESTSSLFVQHHRYNLRNFPSRRLSTDTSTLNLSARSSNSALRLARKHAQPLSSDTHSSELDPQSYFTSGLENASLLSSDVQTAFLSVNLFSEVIKPITAPAHIRIPECYTADHSRPPTPLFAGYPIRVDGTTTYDPKNDPRFPILTERFVINNDWKKETMLEQKLNALKLTKVSHMQKKERKICFQGSVKYQRVDRTVWNQNIMPLPVKFDPLDSKSIIRHLNY